MFLFDNLLEQWSLTGGSESSFAMSEFLMPAASFTAFPCRVRVANDEVMNTLEFEVSYLDPLCGEGGACDGRPAAEGLELGIHDLAVVVDLNLLANKSTGIN